MPAVIKVSDWDMDTVTYTLAGVARGNESEHFKQTIIYFAEPRYIGTI